MITDTFGAKLLTTINDTAANPVHMLFNQWWNEASTEAKDTYVSSFLADPEFRAWYEAGHYNDPLDLDELAAMPDGSLGHTYQRWIVDNGLTAQIALDYRGFHTMLESSGVLDGMPDEMKFAVLRGFQIHDFLHVLTGYDSSGSGEIALQAFSLAQFQFPYFGMWMAVVTAQMTFNEPRSHRRPDGRDHRRVAVRPGRHGQPDRATVGDDARSAARRACAPSSASNSAHSPPSTKPHAESQPRKRAPVTIAQG